jgi:hypothetical protein
VAAIVALAAPAAAQTPGGDTVLGGGSIDTDNAFTWSFNVASGPSGENPTGEVSIRVRPGGPSIESSTVDCLVVNGRTATIAGTLPPNPDGYTDYGVTVVDAGPARLHP